MLFNPMLDGITTKKLVRSPAMETLNQFPEIDADEWTCYTGKQRVKIGKRVIKGKPRRKRYEKNRKQFDVVK